MDATQIIIRPVVSEKSYVLAEAGKYTFRVHDKAHKTQIRQADRAAVRRQGRRRSAPSRSSRKPKRRGNTAGRTRRGRRRSFRSREGQPIPIFRDAWRGGVINGDS